MIQIEKMKDGFFDELFGDCTVRNYAKVRALGWLAAINTTPRDADFSDILNLDIVLTNLPVWLSGKQFYFQYKNGGRVARHDGPLLGEFAHVHLQASGVVVAQLQTLLHKKIEIAGDEIALSRPGGGSFFWVDAIAPVWMGLDEKNWLNIEVSAALIRNKKLNHTSCHSIKPDSIRKVKFFYNGNKKGETKMGSQMGGNFGVGAAGVSGFMGQAAKKSLEKARASGKLPKIGEEQQEGGKAREPAKKGG